jgi:YfiH family protein
MASEDGHAIEIQTGTRPVLLRYDIGPHVQAFSTTRAGGTSRGNYATFNANQYCGDDTAAVHQNRLLLAKELGVSVQNIIIPHQTHSTHVLQIDQRFIHLPSNQQLEQLEGVDALITQEQNICICVSTADCIPIIIYDRKLHAAGIIHAGWRGTCNRIAAQTLAQMHDALGTSAQDCCAVIAPGISLEHFEVGNEVYQAFQEQGFDMQTIASRFPVSPSSNGLSKSLETHEGKTEPPDFPLSTCCLSNLGMQHANDCPDNLPHKWHINLPLCNRLQLVEAGIPEQAITDTKLCTFQHHETFFSARRLGIHSGRMLTGIILQ